MKNPFLFLHNVENVLQRQPRNYFCLMRLGWLNYAAAIYAEALKAYERAAGAMPDAVEPALGALKAAVMLGAWDTAERWGDAAMKKDPSNYTVLSKMAYTMYMKKDYSTAAGFYKKALALYPSDLDMKNGLAWSLAFQGNKTEACRLFQEVIEVSPYNTSAKEGGRVCLQVTPKSPF